MVEKNVSKKLNLNLCSVIASTLETGSWAEVASGPPSGGGSCARLQVGRRKGGLRPRMEEGSPVQLAGITIVTVSIHWLHRLASDVQLQLGGSYPSSDCWLGWMDGWMLDHDNNPFEYHCYSFNAFHGNWIEKFFRIKHFRLLEIEPQPVSFSIILTNRFPKL